MPTGHLSLLLSRLTLDCPWEARGRALRGSVTGCKEGIPSLFLKPRTNLGAWMVQAPAVLLVEYLMRWLWKCRYLHRLTGLEWPDRTAKSVGHYMAF